MASTREDLIAALGSWGVQLASSDHQVALISSGLLDSTALFNLTLWIEERIGRPIDPGSFDLAQEWDSVESIVAFVQRT